MHEPPRPIALWPRSGLAPLGWSLWPLGQASQAVRPAGPDWVVPCRLGHQLLSARGVGFN
jgi:hypothetical protein